MCKGWQKRILDAKVLVATWIMLNVADLAISMLALNTGCSEVNPILKHLDPPSFIACKIAVPVVVLLVLATLDRIHLLKALNICMALVVIWGLLWV